MGMLGHVGEDRGESGRECLKGEIVMNLPLNIDFSGKVVVVTGAGGVLCGDRKRHTSELQSQR